MKLPEPIIQIVTYLILAAPVIGLVAYYRDPLPANAIVVEKVYTPAHVVKRERRFLHRGEYRYYMVKPSWRVVVWSISKWGKSRTTNLWMDEDYYNEISVGQPLPRR